MKVKCVKGTVTMKMKTAELCKDIFAFAVLLTRFGYEDSVKNQRLFIEMLNEAGFRTVTGVKFTQQSMYSMIKHLHSNIITEIKEEFSESLHAMAFVGESVLVSGHVVE